MWGTEPPFSPGSVGVRRQYIHFPKESKSSRMSGELSLDIDIKEPRWDQGTFMGRAKHFFMITDPRNVLLSSETLEGARDIVENYRWATAPGGRGVSLCWSVSGTKAGVTAFSGVKVAPLLWLFQSRESQSWPDGG